MEQKNNLYAALARAQATYSSAQKNGYNPHFKSNFPTFEDLVSASRESLAREGLSVTQFLDSSDDDKDYLVTLLMHSSGESIKSRMRIYVKDSADIQKFGSAMTYLKRYVYASICGISTSEYDGDGNDAAVEPVINEKQVRLLKVLVKGNKGLEETICAHYSVDSFAHIPAKHMNQIVEKLKKNAE
jgi:hypothetical protein